MKKIPIKKLLHDAVSDTRYQALTIDIHSGKTYWNQSKDTINECIDHVNRYCHKDADVLIYCLSQPILLVGYKRKLSGKKILKEES